MAPGRGLMCFGHGASPKQMAICKDHGGFRVSHVGTACAAGHRVPGVG